MLPVFIGSPIFLKEATVSSLVLDLAAALEVFKVHCVLYSSDRPFSCTPKALLHAAITYEYHFVVVVVVYK